MEALDNLQLGRIVTDHPSTARVLEKYGLDYCCNGKRSLADACRQKGIAAADVSEELQEAIELPGGEQVDFDTWSAEKLITYVLLKHHFYVKQEIPSISFHLSKVADKHGDKFPYMLEVQQLWRQLAEELLSHLKKEEDILFPAIIALEKGVGVDQGRAGLRDVRNPMVQLEHEHDQAGVLMARIRELTNQYTPHPLACTTHRLTLQELAAFELDLHQHIHLENNIIFPKALELNKIK
ncbi:iron-sulfur cluster repair di-iron protein [Flavihumibacter rivuli]|uniref:iron-sulfur cluster repair di-iron protein n=1 Tax=Flavihumibacter rivuli TaxID=2838156 RepID=UPI001BDF1DB5|nr:iron-sulfur cluster repair di-iron protein [Flavihumibacter rivuli]ULQ57978.1 iron-sulfur cluster repair di-iron protein [Flavihumibacter rivuli]